MTPRNVLGLACALDQRKGRALDVRVFLGSWLGSFGARACATRLASNVFSKCWVFATAPMTPYLRAATFLGLLLILVNTCEVAMSERESSCLIYIACLVK